MIDENMKNMGVDSPHDLEYERELTLLESEEQRLFDEMKSVGKDVDDLMTELSRLSPRIRDVDENYDRLDEAFRKRDEAETKWRSASIKLRELIGGKEE